MRVSIIIPFFVFAAFGQDPKDIFRRAVEKDERNYAVRDQYTFREDSTVEFFDKDGKRKSVERTTKDVLFYDGTKLEMVVARSGKSLNERELREEKGKIDKEIAKIKKETPAARAKRRGESAGAQKEELEGRRQLLEAFDLKLLGDAVVNGRPCWLIRGVPRDSFNPKGRRADQLKKFQGEACVDKTTSDWMRLDMKTTDTISLGLFLLRLQPDAAVKIDQTRMNDEVCFPKTVSVSANARLLGMMKRVRIEVNYSDFKKFSAESTITFQEPKVSSQD